MRTRTQSRSTSSRSTAGAAAIGAGLGALAAYFLDPDLGRGRRAEATDRLAGVARRTGRRMGRGYRHARAVARGVGARIAPRQAGSGEWLNDETLAHKVESELFRDPSVPKGSMNVNAEHGTVVLRGVVESQDQIERIMLEASAIDGVRVVHSRLRTPSQPAATAFERKRDLQAVTSRADGR